MDVSSVTVGLPVHDLSRATGWYRRTLGLGAPDLQPVEDVVEFRLGAVWLQLVRAPTARSGAEVVVRLGVPDAAEEHRRLADLGVAPGPLEHVEGVVDHFTFSDPDGNRLGVYSTPASPSAAGPDRAPA